MDKKTTKLIDLFTDAVPGLAELLEQIKPFRKIIGEALDRRAARITKQRKAKTAEMEIQYDLNVLKEFSESELSEERLFLKIMKAIGNTESLKCFFENPGSANAHTDFFEAISRLIENIEFEPEDSENLISEFKTSGAINSIQMLLQSNDPILAENAAELAQKLGTLSVKLIPKLIQLGENTSSINIVDSIISLFEQINQDNLSKIQVVYLAFLKTETGEKEINDLLEQAREKIQWLHRKNQHQKIILGMLS